MHDYVHIKFYLYFFVIWIGFTIFHYLILMFLVLYLWIQVEFWPSLLCLTEHSYLNVHDIAIEASILRRAG